MALEDFRFKSRSLGELVVWQVAIDGRRLGSFWRLFTRRHDGCLLPGLCGGCVEVYSNASLESRRSGLAARH